MLDRGKMDDITNSLGSGAGNSPVAPINKDSYQLEVTRPVWLPYNDTSHLMVASLVKRFEYPTTGPKADKYAGVLASLLKASQALLRSIQSKRPHYIGVQRRASGWSQYPMVGREISKKVVDDFLDYFDGQLVQGSGSSGLYKDEEGKWRTDPIMSMYQLDIDKLPADLSEARFIEVGRPLIKVNKAETRQQKASRKAQRLSKPYLNSAAARRLNEGACRASESRLQRLNDFWFKHPLVLPSGHAAASVTRVFHDGRLDAGGRLYGAWTGLDQKESRLNCTIDGEPVVEIDIRASQPTLLSSLLGYRLGGLGPLGEWGDVYAELSSLANIDHWWSVVDDTIDVIDQIKRNRNVAKGVVMALIGSGLPLKSRATTELAESFGLTPQGWKLFRDRLVETIPALNQLEPRYDEQGYLHGYINGAGFLSHHESEMMLETLERLMDLKIPAYSVHDCVVVKASDAITSAKVFRQTIHDYCNALSGIKVLVPLSVTVGVDIPKQLMPLDVDLKGRYLS